MAKAPIPKIKFSYADGSRVGRTEDGRSVVLRAPKGLKTVVPPGGTRIVRLGVRCDHPLFLWEACAGDLFQRGLRINEGSALPADRDLEIVVRNNAAGEITVTEGDALAYATPLLTGDFEVEG